MIQRHAGVRPISLIGFSLGARAIFYALVELARVKAYGIVQDVFIFGATVTASKQTWLEVRSAVAGRFVNGYATNDWMLGYLFRATSGGINTVAGLRPVEITPGLENVDVTEIITGHMSYRSCMPLLLAQVGFPITAEHFDEPDVSFRARIPADIKDPEVDMSIQERTVINEAEEEVKRNKKKILGIFPRRDKSLSASGATTPNPDARTSTEKASQHSGEYDDDDGDLPPREDGDIGLSPLSAMSKESLAEEDEAVRAISKTAGFDFKAISKELGKDIDVDRLKQPATRPMSVVEPIIPPERTGSAPPIHVDPPPEERLSMARSMSYAPSMRDQEGEADDGYIAVTANRQLSIGDLPSWNSSSSVSPKPSPPASAWFRSSPITAFNAWSALTSPSTFPSRAAPPARPHPPELMSNPFADGSVSNGILGGWGKEKELAEKNPW